VYWFPTNGSAIQLLPAGLNDLVLKLESVSSHLNYDCLMLGVSYYSSNYFGLDMCGGSMKDLNWPEEHQLGDHI
jgi:hypothetical protein